MRSVGLLYVEQVKELNVRCSLEGHDDCASRVDSWSKLMAILDDRIEIEGYATNADALYYHLLRNAQHARLMHYYSITLEHANPSVRAWLDADYECVTDAYKMAKSGLYVQSKCDHLMEVAHDTPER
jgi:hypothetical protein